MKKKLYKMILKLVTKAIDKKATPKVKTAEDSDDDAALSALVEVAVAKKMVTADCFSWCNYD